MKMDTLERNEGVDRDGRRGREREERGGGEGADRDGGRRSSTAVQPRGQEERIRLQSPIAGRWQSA